MLRIGRLTCRSLVDSPGLPAFAITDGSYTQAAPEKPLRPRPPVSAADQQPLTTSTLTTGTAPLRTNAICVRDQRDATLRGY